MSRRIFRDVEEALAREIRRITFHNERTRSTDVLQEMFDPITGEIVQRHVEPRFYDSSADTSNILYPHIFVKILKTREDTTSGRVEPPYGGRAVCYNQNAPKAYEIIYYGADGTIPTVGSILSTNNFKIARVQAGYWVRIVSGNNKGTYKITSVTTGSPGQITVSNNLLENLPTYIFELTTRKAVFTGVDLATIKIGDNLVDSLLNSYAITAVDLTDNSITIGGVGSPSITAGAKISRTGNVFQATDITPIKYVILDPSKPIMVNGVQVTSAGTGMSPQIPLDNYYLVRIDSKERITHIDILNRVWEEFNPPRTALPVIVRSKDSGESLLAADVASGGSTTLTVASNADFDLGDPVFVFDDLSPTKADFGFSEPFASHVVGKVSTNQIVLANSVPDTYTVSNGTKVVSNASYKLLMFHFVNHDTKDNEGAQYWVHEFTFWVQTWVDRLETPTEFNNPVLDISTPIEDLDGNVIIEDL